jgi:peptidoglycan hydrolase CwlO-like protein
MAQTPIFVLVALAETLWQSYKETGYNRKNATRVLKRMEKELKELEKQIPRVKQEIESLREMYKK